MTLFFRQIVRKYVQIVHKHRLSNFIEKYHKGLIKGQDIS